MSAARSSEYGAPLRRDGRSVARRVAVLASALGALALSTTANAGVPVMPTAPSCPAITPDGAWTRLGIPTFASGPAAVSGFAVSPGATTVYATNGISVASTTDLGCHWRPVFTAASTATGAERVIRVVTPPTGAAGTVYVVTEQTLVGVASSPATTLQASTDSGARWTASKPLPGSAVDVAAGGGTSSRTVYALLRQAPVTDPVLGATARAATVLARTDDAGANWTVSGTQTNGPSLVVPLPTVGPAAADATTPQFSGVVVDPGNAKRVWLASPTGLWTSTDGGSTITSASPAASEGVVQIAAGRTVAGKAEAAFTYKVSRFPAVGYTRADAKTPDTFAVAELPGAMTSLTMGIRPGEFIVSGTKKVWLHRPAAGFTLPVADVSPARAHLRELVGVRRGKAADVTVFGRDGQQIEFRTMPAPLPPKPPKPPTTGSGDDWIFVPDTTKIIKGGAPSINPDHVQITLPVGSQREIPYALSLPGTRKVDVFFLVDTTDSMADKIDAMKRGLGTIINDFAKAGVDARFGVGQYRAYETAPAYQRMSDLVKASDKSLTAAVNALTANGGNHKQTSLDALYQIATGKGLQEGTAFIAAGQQTHWRDDALHVVLHITDEGFAVGAPHPSFEQVAAALKAKHVLQIGVGYKSTDPADLLKSIANGENPNTTADLIDMARMTNAVAPPDGTDCNGDGQADLLPGAPLVCTIAPKAAGEVSTLAAAIVNVVLAAPDFAPVSVTWAAPKPVIAGVTPRIAPGVNLRHPATLSFRVTYACPADLPAGTGYPAALTARVRNTVVAVARALVDCVADPLPLPGDRPGVAVAVLTVPPPPANPLTNVQPNPQPQSQPQTQPQAQAQAQAGVAFQEQESPQFAFAYTNTGPAPEPEQVWQFSAYHPSAPSQSPAAPFATLGGGAFAALVAARVLAVRRRQQHARATVRRTPPTGGR